MKRRKAFLIFSLMSIILIGVYAICVAVPNPTWVPWGSDSADGHVHASDNHEIAVNAYAAYNNIERDQNNWTYRTYHWANALSTDQEKGVSLIYSWSQNEPWGPVYNNGVNQANPYWEWSNYLSSTVNKGHADMEYITVIQAPEGGSGDPIEACEWAEF